MTWQLFRQRPNKNGIESSDPTKPVVAAATVKRSRSRPGWFRGKQPKNSDVNLSCPTLSTTESSFDAIHWNDSMPSAELEASTEQEQQRGDQEEEVRCSEPRTSTGLLLVEDEDLAYDSYRPAPRNDDDSVSTMSVDDDLDYSNDDSSCIYINDNDDDDSLEKEYLTNDSYPEARPETVWKIDILDHMLLERQRDPHAMPIRQPLYFRICFPNEDDVCYMGKQVLGMVQDLIEFSGRSAFELRRLSNNEVTVVPSSEVIDALKQILHESSYLSCPEEEFHRASSSLSQCAAATTTRE